MCYFEPLNAAFQFPSRDTGMSQDQQLASDHCFSPKWKIQMAKKVERKTQAERSALMRHKILSSTLDCIFKLGYQNVSTNVVVQHANISRGALLHHFPTKEALIAASVEMLLEDEIKLVRQKAGAYRENALTIDDFVDFLWERFSGRLFMITIDFLSRARTDEALREAIIPPSLNFHKSLNEIWSKFFVLNKSSSAEIEVLLNTTLCLMRGMGVQSIVRKDSEYFTSIASYWKHILRDSLTGAKPLSLVEASP
jgi:AcrR family transcriptional regulator